MKITTPAALVGVGTLVVSGVGVADAATGGNFILGKSNSASTLTTLTNTNGTALSLKSKSGFPSLAVNSTKLVPHLNANFLNGLTASKFQRRVTGTCAATGVRSVGSTGSVTCTTPQQIVFTASGNYTVPAGVTHITGELWGAGGGAFVSGGGGGGAYESVLVNVTPGQVVNVVVGQGGSGGGGAGTASSLAINNGSVFASAGGGGAGLFPCSSGLAPGGTAGATTAPAVRLVPVRTGGTGYCYQFGNAGYPGAGGASNYATGSNGLVILNISS